MCLSTTALRYWSCALPESTLVELSATSLNAPVESPQVGLSYSSRQLQDKGTSEVLQVFQSLVINP